jgi:IS30 family transposase
MTTTTRTQRVTVVFDVPVDGSVEVSDRLRELADRVDRTDRTIVTDDEGRVLGHVEVI